jgi:anti-sigma regulatory factor (Ser/Thr protein kinase)
LPAAPDVLGLVRLFAASIGRHVTLPPEIVEDLKLVLTEVCSAAIEASTEQDVVTVTMSWLPDPSALMVRVSSSSGFSTGDAARDDRARLLDALRIELRPSDDAHGVEFTVPTTSSP